MAKPKNRRKKPRSPASFAQARARIASAGNLRHGLARYKGNATVSELRRTLPEFLANRIYRQLIWPDPKPRTYGKLASPGLPGCGTVFQEVEWLVQSLLPFRDDLHLFANKKAAYDKAILLGTGAECNAILDQIERDFGLSVWLIGSRINTIQQSGGLSKQREYTRRLITDPSLSKLIKYIVSWMGFRTESNISAVEFQSMLTSDLPQRDGFFGLVEIVLGGCPALGPDEAGQTLAFTDLVPLIDRYVFGVSIIQAFIANTPEPSHINTIAYSLAALAEQIHDPALERLLIACGATRRQSTMPPLLSLLDNYTAGQYAEAQESARRLITSDGSIDALQLYLRAGQASHEPNKKSLDISEDALLDAIHRDLREVISYSPAAPDAAARLAKKVLTHSQSGWAASLALVSERQKRDERIFRPTRSQIFNALRSNDDNPILAFNFEPLGAATRYLASIGTPSNSSLTKDVALALIEPNDRSNLLETLPHLHREKLCAALALRQGAAEVAIQILTPTYAASDLGFRKYEIGLLLAESLLRAGELLACAEVCAELFLNANFLGDLLPIERLVNALIERDEQSPRSDYLLGRLQVVIVFDMFSRHVSPSRDAERADAFNDFLRVRGVTKASDLLSDGGDLPQDQLIYFLRDICVPAVLDQSLALKSTREVEDERAKILVQVNELLISANATPSSELMEELQEIRTKQVIRDTTLQLDQSKIYVDVEGIRKTLGPQLKESWNRYRLLSMQGDATTTEEDLVRAIQTAVGERFTVVSLALPVTERNQLFERMVKDILEQFSTSKVFGLDANLSTNIRHGYVLRELRKPFVVNHLVTNRVTEASEYQANQYWIGRVCPDSGSQAAFDSALNNLSRSVDEEIEHLNGSLLRIRTAQFPDGLFDFPMTHPQLQILQRKADELETYDEFFDDILATLWQSTSRLLERVREHLMTSTLSRLQGALTRLQEELEACCGHLDISALITAINLVRPEVRAAVERVANWFTLSESQDYQDYPLKIAFDAGLATVASYYSHMDMRAEFDAPAALTMAGWTLPHFTRLFSILLENAAAHSGISEGTLSLECEAAVSPGYLHLKLANQLASDLDEAELQARVSALNAEFGRDAASDFVHREGKSGYPKIWKILKHDLRREHELIVSLAGGPYFVVEILMDTRGITP